MIAVNHPGLGAALTQDPLARSVYPIYRPVQSQPNPIRSVAFPVIPEPVKPPENQISPPPIQIVPLGPGETSSVVSSSPFSASTMMATSGELPIQVSSIVDPVTGVTYAGYLTVDAQALYNSGSLLTGGNQLTPQGSALAAQGDLIEGTPAPSAAQIAQAHAAASTTPAPADASTFTNWLSEETLIIGYPNGAVAALGVIAVAWLFGGKKKRR